MACLKNLLRLGLCSGLILFLGFIHTAAQAVTNAIPFKQEALSFPEQSLTALVTTVVLLALTIAGLYLFKKYLIKNQRRIFPGATLQIKERLRVNHKLTIYIVTYQNKEVMFAQSGDSIAPLAEFAFSTSQDVPSSAVTTPEASSTQPSA